MRVKILSVAADTQEISPYTAGRLVDLSSNADNRPE
jgi:hypothetical protein